MTQALFDRLAVFYDESYAARVMLHAASWPNGAHPAAGGTGFGAIQNQIRTVVPHFTAGWPSRNKASSFVGLFTTPGHVKWGVGPQFYLSNDGTAARLIDLPRLTWHATFINQWSFGIENGNLADGSATDPDPNQWTFPPHARWIQVNRVAATQANDDIPGARFWLRDHNGGVPREVLCSAWTTAGFTGPRRAPVANSWMQFTEWQYRSLALLCRYLAEEWQLPRNVPLLPHTLRSDVIAVSDRFRRIVLADPAFTEIAAATTPFHLTGPDYAAANAAAFQATYATHQTGAVPHGAVAPAGGGLKLHNRAWRALFDVFRGFHGHGYPGTIATGRHDHDCPGPLFDWYRFARELWDYWWLPFDVDAAGSTAVPRRAYQNPDGATPVHEFYFDENEVTRLARIRIGVHGPTSSPETFTLDANSPVYAMANGELVAARIPPAAPGHASTAFVLVRHEVFHLPHPLAAPMAVPLFPFLPPMTLRPGAIDYAREPSYVYTLYMHLGRQGGVDLQNVSGDNPDWLNRILIRKKECDLGVTFYDGHPAHHGIPDAAWNTVPPGSQARPSLLDAWRIDQLHLDYFLARLATGEVAIGAPRDSNYRPIKILLGDHLGRAGVCSVVGGVSTHGVRVEAFSPFPLPGFSAVVGQNDWSPPAGLPNPPALFYQSEWARAPVGAEADRLRDHGFDPATSLWWNDVSLTTAWADPSLPAAAQLQPNGFVWHYRALDVARWLNQLTWKHEREKYASPTAAAMLRPPTRRV